MPMFIGSLEAVFTKSGGICADSLLESSLKLLGWIFKTMLIEVETEVSNSIITKIVFKVQITYLFLAFLAKSKVLSNK